MKSRTRGEVENSKYNVNIMICGCCGDIIARKKPGNLFNIIDSSWKCDFCDTLGIALMDGQNKSNILFLINNNFSTTKFKK